MAKIIKNTKTTKTDSEPSYKLDKGVDITSNRLFDQSPEYKMMLQMIPGEHSFVYKEDRHKYVEAARLYIARNNSVKGNQQFFIIRTEDREKKLKRVHCVTKEVKEAHYRTKSKE